MSENGILRRGKAGILATLVAAGATVGAWLGIINKSVETEQDRFYEIAATQDIRYQAVPIKRDGWGISRDLSSTIEIMRDRLSKHRVPCKPEGYDGCLYIMKPKNRANWSNPKPLNKILTKLSEVLKNGPVNKVWLVRAVLDRYTEKARKIDKNPAVVMDTEGTLAIDIVAGTAFSKFPDLRNIGIFACRRISGSYTWSQHAYKNAIDFGGNTDLLDKAANYLYFLTKKGYLPASQILWKGKNMISGSNVKNHYDHIHVSGKPLMSGTPECAG